MWKAVYSSLDKKAIETEEGIDLSQSSEFPSNKEGGFAVTENEGKPTSRQNMLSVQKANGRSKTKP